MIIWLLIITSVLWSPGLLRQSSVEISFVGDVYPEMMDGITEKSLEKQREYFKESDIVFCNLESPITRSNSKTGGKSAEAVKAKKDYILKSDPSTAGYLKKSGITAVSLANNHIMDYGDVGLKDTINILKKLNIGYCGAGDNVSEAESALIVDVRGRKVAFAGFSEIKPIGSAAGDYYPGIATIQYPPGKADLLKIKRSMEKAAKEGAEIFIVSIHWGKEHSGKIESYQREFARQLIDEGVDCVVGHHPHVLRDVEYYGDKTIAYSLGNYFFMSPVGKTIILKVRFKRDFMGKWTQKAVVEKMKIKNGIPDKETGK